MSEANPTPHEPAPDRPSARFRPHERIRRGEDFRRAFARKRSAGDDRLVVYAAENGLKVARLGLSVSKKKARRAHDRNRIKRLLREAFRLNKAFLPVGLDYVVVPKTADLDFAKARESLATLAQAAARRLRPRPPAP